MDQKEPKLSSFTLNEDCLIGIFQNLSMTEKLKCRLVCHRWKMAIDKMVIGQHRLEIYAAHSSVAAAAIVQATGVIRHDLRWTTTTKVNYFLDSAMNGIKNTWMAINGKLSARTSAAPAAAGTLPSMAAAAEPPSHDRQPNNSEASNNNGNEQISLLFPGPEEEEHPITQALSSPYWTYAFCASSSLFSSYSFAQSTTTTHDFSHSFCDCYSRQKYKYSIILDRHRITFETFDILLRKFSNVNYLVIRNIDQLSDVLFIMITQHCRKVRTLGFTSCCCSGSPATTANKGANNGQQNQHVDDWRQVPALNCLTDYSWRLLNREYPNLTSLTLRQCKLTEKQLTQVIRNCSRLCFLDISDNLEVGKSVRYLGPNIECLICGDLTNNESIGTILSNIAFGNGRNLKYLSIFGALGSLKAFNEFSRLTQLELHFYTEDESSPCLADIGMVSLTSLVLEQIRCYESPSAVNHTHFEQMLGKSRYLQRLQITGDFDWNLRLNDTSMLSLTRVCPHLKELTLNGNGSLTDYGLLHLSALPLTQLSLASFYAVTDYSVSTLIKRIPTLRQVTLVDMPQITERTIFKTITVCLLNHERKVKMTFSDERIGRTIKNMADELPPNLRVDFDQHLCGQQMAQSEPTDIQMLLVILMSAVILGMTLLTTVVVVLVPLSMLLMMAHEWFIEHFLSHLDLYRTILEFWNRFLLCVQFL